jgi:putative N6-adenine-specific DNA methylase
MSDQDSGRKTLTINKRSESLTTSSDGKPRVRIGARARQVAQQKIAKDKAARLKAETPDPSFERSASRSTDRVIAAGGLAPRSSSARGSSRSAALRSGPHEFRDPGERARPLSERTARNSAPKALPQEPEILRSVIVTPTTDIFHIFAPCPVGLEEALGAELSALGYEHVQTTRAGCHFVADWWGVQRANLYSRLATRILVRVGQAPVQHEDDILELAQSIGWERWFGAEHTLRVDTSAVKSPMQSLQYCNLRAKDGICDRLRDLEGARPSIDTVRPDARVHLFLSHDTATMYLDTSGESLFKRGWRLDKGDAPLRENLAAGLLALSGWDPQAALMDPFCGSGTLLIEAAWIALGVPPGITRPFGFERLRDHQARRWEDLKEDARSRILPELEAPLVGIDADPDAIEAAQRNAERAYLTEDTIHFEVGDARDAVAPASTGWMLTNPPYGERLEEEDLEFWREWSANLKREFAGWQVNVITSDLDLPKHLRLKANRRTPIFNGALDCRLLNFELVESSYRNVASTQQNT